MARFSSRNGFVAVTTFFDRQAVIDATTKKQRRVLARSGAFGRTVIRRSIRRRKKVSSPGRPPHAHVSGNEGMKVVVFGLSDDKQSVAIGHVHYRWARPRQYNRAGFRQYITSSKTVPQLLNEGGVAKMITDRRGRFPLKVTARYRSRPFRDLAYPIINQFFQQRLREERY